MNPVFLVGCDRSGTTLLRLMLTRSRQLHIPQETRFYASLRERSADYGDFAQARQRWFFIRDLQLNDATSKTKTFPVFNLSDDEAQEALAANAPMGFPEAAAALFMASARKAGKTRWGDKTPAYVREITWLAAAYPSAQFVHVIRDGRDVALSVVRARWARDIAAAAAFWQERVVVGRAQGAALPAARYREISYEDLVRTPEATLRDLCQWLDLEFEPEMLRYYESGRDEVPAAHAELFELVDKPVDPSRAGAWRRSMPAEDIEVFESLAGGLLRELGYELTGTRAPVLHRCARSIRNALRDVARNADAWTKPS